MHALARGSGGLLRQLSPAAPMCENSVRILATVHYEQLNKLAKVA